MFLLQHGSVPLSDLGVSGGFEEDDNDVATKVSGVRCVGVAVWQRCVVPSCIFGHICLSDTLLRMTKLSICVWTLVFWTFHLTVVLTLLFWQ